MSNCQNLQEPEDRKKEKLKEEEKKKKKHIDMGRNPAAKFLYKFLQPSTYSF